MLTLHDFNVYNVRRCTSKYGFNHPLDQWSLSDWIVAVVGELGEASNIAKKLNRVRDGISGNSETPEQLKENLADELADTFIYLDLLCSATGLSLESIAVRKFNKTCDKLNMPPQYKIS